MKPQPLSYDDMPSLHVPLRFHLTAPLFGLLAAALLFWEGSDAFVTRWSAGSLGATHLLTLGFIAMTMIGSLFQVVPVLGGRAIPGGRFLAPLVHVSLSAGVVALSLSLVRPSRVWSLLAIVLLGAAFLAFVPALGWRVMRIRGGGVSMFAIRFAALALAVTVALGIYLALGRTYAGLGIVYRGWTHVHVAWGLFGWVPLLVMGVSYQVVPMFHVAPEFDPRLARGVPVVVFTSLVLLSHARHPLLVAVVAGCLGAALIVYAGSALRVLSERRRRRRDAVIGFWTLALLSLALGAASFFLGVVIPNGVPLLSDARAPLLLGAVMVIGFACSVIIGMLHKIVPFLVFLHLQRASAGNLDAMRLVPSMNEVISDGAASWQLRLHLATYLAVCAALVWPPLARVAALLLALDFGWLLRSLAVGAVRYRRLGRAIAAV